MIKSGTKVHTVFTTFYWEKILESIARSCLANNAVICMAAYSLKETEFSKVNIRLDMLLRFY